MTTVSLLAKNQTLSGITALIDSGLLNATATITIYTGTMPASPDYQATGTILAVLPMSYPSFGAPANAITTANTITSTNGNVQNSGIAAWFRISNRDAVPVVDGTIVTGGLGDIQFGNVNFVAGGVCQINNLALSIS